MAAPGAMWTGIVIVVALVAVTTAVTPVPENATRRAGLEPGSRHLDDQPGGTACARRR